MRWQWDNSDPFGKNMANENPNGAGTFNFNLRFPGQNYDRETNLHYNIFRDYYLAAK
jgi:RHS repeat-associated protein